MVGVINLSHFLPGDVNASRAKTASNLGARTLFFLLIILSSWQFSALLQISHPSARDGRLACFILTWQFSLFCRDGKNCAMVACPPGLIRPKVPGHVTADGATNVYYRNRRAVSTNSLRCYWPRAAIYWVYHDIHISYHLDWNIAPLLHLDNFVWKAYFVYLEKFISRPIRDNSCYNYLC